MTPQPPFHIIDRNGEVLRSFGARGSRPCATAAGDGGFYTTVPGRYQIERRDRNGEVVEVLMRGAEWYEAYDLKASVAGSPTLCSMSARGDSLWVRIPIRTGAAPSGRLGVAEIDAVMDAIIEVVDLSVGRVVARQRFDNPTILFLEGTDLVSSARQDELGYVYMDLLRPRTVSPER